MHEGTRIPDVKNQISATIKVDNIFSTDGVRVHFLNQRSWPEPVRDMNVFESKWSSVRFRGGTLLGTELKRKVLNPLYDSLASRRKPVLVYIFTDGEVSS